MSAKVHDDGQPDDQGRHEDEPRSAIIRKNFTFSLAWVTPILALGVLVYLIISHVAASGPTVVVTFKTGDGLVVKQTQAKHKSVDLGLVERISLGPDTSSVIVRLKMNHEAKRLMTDHARFWVVRPRLSLVAVSGLETLVSGAYIEVDPGPPGGNEQNSFVGLDEPPGITSDEPGTAFSLEVASLGSLGVGSPIYTHDVKVGEVLVYDLEGGHIALRAFVKAPYDKLVHTDTVFYNASGISVETGADGLHVELQSLEAIFAGAIAFKNPASDSEGAPDDNQRFHVYASKAVAEATLYKLRIPCVAYFDASVSGLARGSAVTLVGVPVGTVSDVDVTYDAKRVRYFARATFDLQPDRIARVTERAQISVGGVRNMVLAGMRVVLDSSNLLTGEKELALRVVPKAPKLEATMEGDALVIPSQSGGLDEIIASMSDVASKLDAIPFDQIGDNLNSTLRIVRDTVGGPELQGALASMAQTFDEAKRLVRDVHSGLGPAIARLPAIAGKLEMAVERANGALGSGGYRVNSDVQRSVARALTEVERTARTVRTLADHFDRQPTELIFGRSKTGGQQ
jgi:paraquat-inducible protein B